MAKNRIIKEELLYDPITKWFYQYLSSKYKKSEVIVWDSHSVLLSRLLQNKGFHNYFNMFDTFEIKVDISAIIIHGNEAQLGFVEVKSGYIRLTNVGQLLGYCKVAQPIEAFIISPLYISSPLHNLIVKYGRHNILDYGTSKIKIAKWNSNTDSIEHNTLIPRGL